MPNVTVSPSVDSMLKASDASGVRNAIGAGQRLELNDVADNAAKLALTGIDNGHIVRITGEANRIEQYTGGSINNDDNWIILGENTFYLKVRQLTGSDATFTNDGVDVVVPSGVSTGIGWVKWGQTITSNAAGSPPPGFNSWAARTSSGAIVNGSSGGNVELLGYPNNMVLFRVMFNVPPRGIFVLSEGAGAPPS